jgi:formylglycine-generating enzyme
MIGRAMPEMTESMVELRGGSFQMGSDRFYPEERPVRLVEVDRFWIDRGPVTVREFAGFVAATGYVTTAERSPTPEEYPDADPDLLVPGSIVFDKTEGPVPSNDVHAWWSYVPGARWDRPEGPDSTTDGRADHPVVHSRTTMRRRTPRGRARLFRRRPSGRSRHAVASTVRPSRGETS